MGKYLYCHFCGRGMGDDYPCCWCGSVAEEVVPLPKVTKEKLPEQFTTKAPSIGVLEIVPGQNCRLTGS